MPDCLQRVPILWSLTHCLRGLHADCQNIEGIHNMAPSTNLADLHILLGIVQFLSRFIPNHASVSAILWDLTKSKNEFQWHPEHQAAVNSIKQMIPSSTSLQYFEGSTAILCLFKLKLPLVAWKLSFFKRTVPSSIGVNFLWKQSNGIPTLRKRCWVLSMD